MLPKLLQIFGTQVHIYYAWAYWLVRFRRTLTISIINFISRRAATIYIICLRSPFCCMTKLWNGFSLNTTAINHITSVQYKLMLACYLRLRDSVEFMLFVVWTRTTCINFESTSFISYVFKVYKFTLLRHISSRAIEKLATPWRLLLLVSVSEK